MAVIDNVQTSPALYYVHTDHLFRPLAMTDAYWNVLYALFGGVAARGTCGNLTKLFHKNALPPAMRGNGKNGIS
ncbi:MAG TPA: hypothetical protein VEK34_07855 [Methylocella sp.]|nr:hypothetical protein [Methylocella sp.]